MAATPPGVYAYPLTPPAGLGGGDRAYVSSSPAHDDEAPGGAWADDVPTRLRRDTPPPTLGKHVRDGGDEPSSHPVSSALPTPKSARLDAAQVLMPTSDAFDDQLDDGWDWDDAQLYSGEALFLATELPPAEDAVRTPRTPFHALVQLLHAIAHTEPAPDALVTPSGGDVALSARALSQLHALVRRCGKEAGGDAPRALRALREVDLDEVARVFGMLEHTMRYALSTFAPADDLETSLCVSTTAMLAAQCVLILLGTAQLPASLFTEELMEQCLAAIKRALEGLVLPLAEACATREPGPLAALAADLVAGERPAESVRDLDRHCHLTCSTMLLVEQVLGLGPVAVSDTLIIASVYLALAPFYAHDSEAAVRSEGRAVYTHAHALRPARMAGLNILRSIFASYPQQRTWVLSELLVSLLRLPDLRQRRRQYRLANGKAVYSVTALFVQLLQAAATDSAHEHERVQAWVDGAVHPDAAAGETSRTAQDTPHDTPLASNQAAVHTLASTIAAFLCQRAAQAKVVKSAHDLTYASIVYSLLEDLLTLLFLPDWPAAPLLLSCFARIFVSYVYDAKSSVDAKAIALDHLGVIAARTWQAQELVRQSSQRTAPLPSWTQMCAARDTHALRRVERAYHGVIQRLGKSHQDEAGMRAATAFYRAQLGYEILSALAALRRAERDAEHDAFCAALAATFRRLPFEATPVRADAHAVPALVLSSSFFVSVPVLTAPLVRGAGAQALAIRTRALRGLGNLVFVHPGLLHDHTVRDVLVAHLTDTSATARETCVAILGRYVQDDSDARPALRPLLAERIHDAAVGVRKRVLRLLHSLYRDEATYADQLDDVVRIVRCVQDDDPGMQTLAVRTLQRLWFPECLDAKERDEEEAEPTYAVAQVLADVCAQLRERPSPLEAFLRRLHDAEKSQALYTRLGALVDCLLGNLLASESTAEAMVDRMRIVQVLVATYPTVLTIHRAKQLLPYVHGAEQPDEVAVMEVILHVYRTCLPHLPRTALAFATTLEQSLTPLVSKCTLAPGSTALQELVACFCAVIRYQTHHTALLQRTLSVCLDRLHTVVEQASDTPLDRNVYLLLCLAALLCEYGEGVASADIDVVFRSLFALLDVASYRQAALTALGYLLRAHPAFFLDHGMTNVLDTIMDTGPPHERQLVLHILLEYMHAEASHAQATGARAEIDQADMLAELTGTTHEHADTGVASALIQRYVRHVLQATLDVAHPALQRTANEILKVSVLQGLSHPIQCMPYLVALETTSDTALRRRAVLLHRHLASKHASLLSARYSEPMRASFAFQQAQTAPERPRGYRVEEEPRALLQTWYALVRDQRVARHAFLKALVRLLDVPDPDACTDEEVMLGAYAAENLATLEYRVLDEPLLVLHELHMLHAEMGMQVYDQARRYLRQREPSPLTDEEDEGGEDPRAPGVPLARAAVLVQMAEQLRAHIKTMYKLSDAYVHGTHAANWQSIPRRGLCAPIGPSRSIGRLPIRCSRSPRWRSRRSGPKARRSRCSSRSSRLSKMEAYPVLTTSSYDFGRFAARWPCSL